MALREIKSELLKPANPIMALDPLERQANKRNGKLNNQILVHRISSKVLEPDFVASTSAWLIFFEGCLFIANSLPGLCIWFPDSSSGAMSLPSFSFSVLLCFCI